MKRIAILGLGLMGGSIGLALKNRRSPWTVAGYARRAETRDLALARNVVDEAHAEPGAAVRDADLVVLCLPIMANLSLLESCLEDLRDDALVTDVGSTKADLTKGIDALLVNRGASYVGSHPVAGSEKQGVEAAIPDLYQDALVIVTPSASSTSAQVEMVSTFWRDLDSTVLVQSAEEHDQWMARTSHLPHMAAAALVASVGRGDDLARIRTFCGSGFRDTTRVAEGSPEVWLDILRTNRQNVVSELLLFKEEIESLCDHLAEERDHDVLSFLATCRNARQELAGPADRTT